MENIKSKLKRLACEYIQKKGVNGFSFRDLANDCGIKSSSVHYHYRGKADIINDTLYDYMTNFFEQVDAISKDKQLKSQFQDLIKIYENVLLADNNCLCGILAAEKDLLDKSTQIRLSNFYEKLKIWFFNRIESKRGEALSGFEDTKSLSDFIVSSLSGGLLIDRLQGRGKNSIESIKNVLNVIF